MKKYVLIELDKDGGYIGSRDTKDEIVNLAKESMKLDREMKYGIYKAFATISSEPSITYTEIQEEK